MPGGGEFYKKDVEQTLKVMHEKGLYGKMLIYITACFGGSMFTDLPPDTK